MRVGNDGGTPRRESSGGRDTQRVERRPQGHPSPKISAVMDNDTIHAAMDFLWIWDTIFVP